MATKRKIITETNTVETSDALVCIPENQVIKKHAKHVRLYVVFSLLFFILGAGISIATLVREGNVIAAPKPVLSPIEYIAPGDNEFEYGPRPSLTQPSFFNETLENFKNEKQSFIEANLSEMKIRYYKDGEVAFESDILSKGREGSWWETPAGLYSIQSKSPNHFSSFGHVYQPWSMVFQGNFFIHGWPYYPDGTPVSSQYSGGCIRLADEDAKQLYDLVSEQTPVLIYEEAEEDDTFEYGAALPVIDAAAYLAADVKNGTILASSESREPFAFGRSENLMMALISAEYMNLDKEVTLTGDLLENPDPNSQLTTGLSLSAYSLLFPLLLENSNTAPEVTRSLMGDSTITKRMNQKAKALGMTSTTFVTASDQTKESVTTAEDLLRLARYLYGNRSFVLRISSGKTVHGAYEAHEFDVFDSTNNILNKDTFIGGISDGEQADQTATIVLYHMEFKGEDRPIVFIISGSSDHKAAVEALYTYLEKTYQ